MPIPFLARQFAECLELSHIQIVPVKQICQIVYRIIVKRRIAQMKDQTRWCAVVTFYAWELFEPPIEHLFINRRAKNRHISRNSLANVARVQWFPSKLVTVARNIAGI